MTCKSLGCIASYTLIRLAHTLASLWVDRCGAGVRCRHTCVARANVTAANESPWALHWAVGMNELCRPWRFVRYKHAFSVVPFRILVICNPIQAQTQLYILFAFHVFLFSSVGGSFPLSVCAFIAKNQLNIQSLASYSFAILIQLKIHN